MSLRVLLPALLLAGLLLVGCESEEPAQQATTVNQTSFREDGTLNILASDGSVAGQIAVEIADSAEERAQGLMFRSSLPARSGMLFLFEEADSLSFWMRNTLMPLDIVFVGPDSQIVNVVYNTRPYSETNVRSTDLAQYVVEVRAGQARTLGLTPGTALSWKRTDTLP